MINGAVGENKSDVIKAFKNLYYFSCLERIGIGFMVMSTVLKILKYSRIYASHGKDCKDTSGHTSPLRKSSRTSFKSFFTSC